MSYPCGLGTKAIISTLPEKLKQYDENELYKEYQAECLRMITENMAKGLGGGCYMAISYHDIINPKPKDNRTPEEIAMEVLDKAGLVVI